MVESQAYAGGGTSNESTKQTGRRTIWVGSAVDPPAYSQTQHIRDIYTIVTPTEITDESQAIVHNSWKTQAKVTCTKS